MDVHELTAAYALDALDADERARYEAHLAGCERCRDELEGFWQVAGALGRAAGGPPPPASLRNRILEQARSEGGVVVPLRRRRWALPLASSVAAAAAIVAVAIGVWAVDLSEDLDDAREELAVLSDPNARTVETASGEADLIVTPTGAAALVVRRLAPAPAGKDYEIWVIEDGEPRAAGLFEEPGVALLTRRVERGQTVAVTLEPDGGLTAPSGTPLFTAAT